ncbi:hypothetical protein EJB05_55199 [Eragrostis curvula]|uniref:Uncharacterized protein n=1 Tax=Eragrostis curvula TaxID=38414 RepID=A0A5J9SKB8_9POAL|nr:hypothetical protein EJB05_55199 [Eragrostis curvula]
MTNTCNLLEEEIRTTPKGPGRAGKDPERINKGMHMKLPIHIFEGKKWPEVPRQAAKLATEASIVLRRHIPVLPRWNKLQHEQDHLSNYIKKVSETCLANQRNHEKVRMYQRTGSRCYVAQAHAVRVKFKDAEPTAVDLFREFHSSRKTGSVSGTDDMEAMMEEPVREGEEPMSPGRAVREVVRASTFLEVVGLQSKKKLRVPVCSRLEALIAELEREKAESRQVEQIVEQQIDALRKQVQEERDSNRPVEAQLEHLRKESARKASMIACLMSNFEGGQVHPSSLTFE